MIGEGEIRGSSLVSGLSSLFRPPRVAPHSANLVCVIFNYREVSFLHVPIMETIIWALSRLVVEHGEGCKRCNHS